MKRRVLGMLEDFTVAALIITIVWGMDYKIPKKGVNAVSLQETLTVFDKLMRDELTQTLESMVYNESEQAVAILTDRSTQTADSMGDVKTARAESTEAPDCADFYVF